MPKKLKICLAMGGGVSLGTFSGAALTESLKLLLVYGKDGQGDRYSSIELDGMSGASAGAMSLGIMLRALLDYKSIFTILNEGLNEEDEQRLTEESIKERLRNQFGDTVFDDRSLDFPSSLVALEVAQMLQHKIWVEELDIKDLFGTKSEKNFVFPLNKPFALLSKKIIKETARKYISRNVEEITSKTMRVVSKKRFLFACSLTNLASIKSPLVLKRYNKIVQEKGADNKKNDLQLVGNLLQSISSYSHSELRVFDFIFKDNVEHKDDKWVEFSLNPKKQKIHSNKAFNIQSSEAWNTLAASVVACGAFPMAFEPVMLKRYSYEFPKENWPLQNFQQNPECLTDFIDEKNNSLIESKSQNFAYIDGGTFNNEPIKEAFKIANFIDSSKEGIEEKGKFDRIILFVDPIVKTKDPRYSVSSFSPIKSEKETSDSIAYSPNSELTKAISLGSHIIGVLQKEASVKEEHKVDRYVENLKLSESLIQYLSSSSIAANPHSPALIETTFIKLIDFLYSGMIPSGTRDPSKYVENYLELSDDPSFDDLKAINGSYVHVFLNEIEKCVTESKSIAHLFSSEEKVLNLSVANRNDIFRLILMILADISLNTAGKDKRAVRVAITPYDIESKKTVKLKGSEVSAFGGFASETSRDLAFEMGRLCAYDTLSSKAFRFYYHKVMNIPVNEENSFFPLVSDLGYDNVKYKQKIRDLEFELEKENYGNVLGEKIYKYGINRLLNMVRISFANKAVGSLATYIGGIPATLLNPIVFFMPKKMLKLYTSLAYKSKMISEISNSTKDKRLVPISLRIFAPKLSSKVSIKLRDSREIMIKGVKNKINRNKKEVFFRLYLDIPEDSTQIIKFYTKEYINSDKLQSSDVTSIIFKLFDVNYIPLYKKEVNLVHQIHQQPKDIYNALLNVNYFINPTLNVKIDKDKNVDFTFLENTLAFSKELAM